MVLDLHGLANQKPLQNGVRILDVLPIVGVVKKCSVDNKPGCNEHC